MFWFKKKQPIQMGLDKHTNRYIKEHFSDYCEAYSFSDFMGYIQMANDYDDLANLSHAIDDLFEGDQKTFLKTKLWDKQFGRETSC